MKKTNNINKLIKCDANLYIDINKIVYTFPDGDGVKIYIDTGNGTTWVRISNSNFNLFVEPVLKRMQIPF